VQPDVVSDGTTADVDGADATPAACDLTKDFGTPVIVEGLPTGIFGPRLTADEKIAFYGRRIDDAGTFRIFSATRTGLDKPFGGEELIPLGSSGPSDNSPSITGDGLTLVFDSIRSSGLRNYIATRTSNN